MIDADFVVVTLPLGVLKVGDGAGLVHDGADGGDGGAIEEIDGDGFGDEVAAAGAWFSPKPPPQVADVDNPALVRAARGGGRDPPRYEGSTPPVDVELDGVPRRHAHVGELVLCALRRDGDRLF